MNAKARAERRLAAIIESSDDAIVSKDLNGIVTSWNRAAERMFGYKADEVVGQSITIIIPKERLPEEQTVLSHIRRGEKVDHFETWRRRKDGTLIPISLTVSPIHDDDGQVIGASKIARDISERVHAEEERTRLLAEVREQAAITERLNDVGRIVVSRLDHDRILQAVTDAATHLTQADFGTFVPGLAIQRVVRLADVSERREEAAGVAAGRDVRSYLAVPVHSRGGETLGGLVFGHAKPGIFLEKHEQIALGIATWASVALENARLYKEVQEASRLKDEFLATLSHELRTPLNAILGYARMVRSGLLEEAKRERAIEVIERNATSLAQIVEDVLDVSRITAGKIRLNVEPVDMTGVIRNAIASVVPAADARGVAIDTEFDPDVGPVSADPERLQQVLWNLLSNAVKFTGRGGRVNIKLRRSGSQVEIVVSDTGVGIPADFLPYLFDRFRQADARTTREQGGLGLGLAIARHLVEMHGGTISAASAGEGKGSTFQIILPVMAIEPLERDATDRPEVAPGSPDVTLANLSGIRVLAVDDDGDALRLVRELLEAAGAHVTTASSALEALSLLSAARPDVLLADLGMPRMDGFELIARVRQEGNADVRNVPAAALTAYARSEDRAKVLSSGFQVHLSKPIDPNELMAVVAALAGKAAN